MSERTSANDDIILVKAFGRLMQEHPMALLGTEKLPASKKRMKAAIKKVWQLGPEGRKGLDIAYIHLSHFQDGIGDAIHLCVWTNDRMEAMHDAAAPWPESRLQQWIAWEKVSMAEAEILMEEWKAFERKNI